MELLRVLSDAPGVSGFEERVQQIVKAELEQACDEVWVDKIGNVVGVKRGQGAEHGTAESETVLSAGLS